MELYEVKQKQEIEDFISNSDISSLYWTWSRVIDNYGIDLANIFIDIDLTNTSYVDRKPELSWWPKNKLAIIRKDFIDHESKWPGTIGSIHPYEYRKGELQTLEYLWPIRKNLEKVFALLLCCSLFPRMKSYRSQYPHDNWPPYYCVNEIYLMANEFKFNKIHQDAWHGSCTKVIPISNGDYHYTIDTASGLSIWLKNTHSCYLNINL